MLEAVDDDVAVDVDVADGEEVRVISRFRTTAGMPTVRKLTGSETQPVVERDCVAAGCSCRRTAGTEVRPPVDPGCSQMAPRNDAKGEDEPENTGGLFQLLGAGPVKKISIFLRIADIQ